MLPTKTLSLQSWVVWALRLWGFSPSSRRRQKTIGILSLSSVSSLLSFFPLDDTYMCVSFFFFLPFLPIVYLSLCVSSSIHATSLSSSLPVRVDSSTSWLPKFLSSHHNLMMTFVEVTGRSTTSNCKGRTTINVIINRTHNCTLPIKTTSAISVSPLLLIDQQWISGNTLRPKGRKTTTNARRRPPI